MPVSNLNLKGCFVTYIHSSGTLAPPKCQAIVARTRLLPKRGTNCPGMSHLTLGKLRHLISFPFFRPCLNLSSIGGETAFSQTQKLERRSTSVRQLFLSIPIHLSPYSLSYRMYTKHPTGRDPRLLLVPCYRVCLFFFFFF